MPDILGRVGIKSSLDKVYQAVATPEGVAGWWTTDVKGDSKVGGGFKATFGTVGFFEMKFLELDRAGRVLWQVVQGPPEWIGTKVSFELQQDNDYVIVLFKHLGWKEPVEFMHHCSTKWAIFLMSIKSMVETGQGAPFPNDVKIDNWN